MLLVMRKKVLPTEYCLFIPGLWPGKLIIQIGTVMFKQCAHEPNEVAHKSYDSSVSFVWKDDPPDVL